MITINGLGLKIRFNPILTKNNSRPEQYKLFTSGEIANKCHGVMLANMGVQTESFVPDYIFSTPELPHPFRLGLGVTGFTSSMYQDIGILHSWEEDKYGQYAINGSLNYYMNIDDFYKLTEPQITSKLETQTIMADFALFNIFGYPNMKEYLVERDKVVKRFVPPFF